MRGRTAAVARLGVEIVVALVTGVVAAIYSHILVAVFRGIFSTFSWGVVEEYWQLCVIPIALGIAHVIAYFTPEQPSGGSLTQNSVVRMMRSFSAPMRSFFTNMWSFPLVGALFFTVSGLVDYKVIFVGAGEALTTKGILVQLFCFVMGIVEFVGLFIVWAYYLGREAIAAARV